MPFHFNDSVNILSKLTLPRLWNAAKVGASFHISKALKKPVNWGLPVSLSLEPTTACNLRCPECPSGLRAFTRPAGKTSTARYKDLIDRAYRHLCCMIFYFQGEPYLHPDLLEMVAYAARKNIYTITSTNGHFLDSGRARRTVESGLDRLIISIDGITQNTYEQYRVNGDLNKVLDGARQIVRWKKELKTRKPHLIFQFLVVRPNEHQIPEVFKLAEAIGFDEVRLKTAQLYNYKNGHPLIPADERYARYRRQPDGTYQLKYHLLNQCWRLWHSCVVTWDGQVVPCCFDKDAQHPMGKLEDGSLKEIWKGKAYRQFRKQILKGRSQVDICTNCTEGCKIFS